MAPSEQQTDGLYSPAVETLVAIAAAIACNGETCLHLHLQKALELGVPRGDVALAIATARHVKEQAAQRTLKSAGEQLAAAREIGPMPGPCACRKSFPS